MAGYRYSISLRLRHPTILPDAVTEALSIQPSRSWVKGQRQPTSSGAPLQGIYNENYWTARLLNGDTASQNLRDALRMLMNGLKAHKQFFRDVASSDGRSEFFIGWFIDGNSGDVLDHALLAELAELQIDLSFDIYATGDDEADVVQSMVSADR